MTEMFEYLCDLKEKQKQGIVGMYKRVILINE